MATTDEALSEFRAARNELYSASSDRDRLATGRVRILSDIDDANNRITAARARVNTARAAVLAAIQAEGQALVGLPGQMVAATETGAHTSVNTNEGP